MKSKTEIRKENSEFFAGLFNKARAMKGVKVPKYYYLPAINKMLTAGEETKAIRMVREAFNKNPETEFKQSFQSWAPKTALEIIKWEIVPMIHERINIRQLMDEKPNSNLFNWE